VYRFDFHVEFDDYEVTVDDRSQCVMVHIACGATVATLTGVYLSYLTRGAATHTRVCSALSAVGRHASVR